ncbi:MAG TPA: HlyD family efflux transporter periplasmic adaptor subunit [Candidatus Lachnoclostridium stercorigallinarum]|uniref:HlyD family efflux transporter periplasmic adaptor subunit n=1 Tax=Candidatus Lachnoclostridium stercorigallinarum TaxID=2838634 RepID=A0A9D2GHP6_9FIRM|nr:HlyD family efflux transporter periplasmic adaptor subunit [Candidatus Lachnoclostridium stercorigallinarum]
MKKSGKKPWSGKLTKRRVIIGAAAVIALIAVVSRMTGGSRETAGDPAQEQKTAVVQRQDITSTLSASGSLEAKDSYNITSLVEGEVLTADFEEGDQVTEGQVLYQIDSSSMQSQLTSAQNSLQRAQDNLADAQADYSEAQAKFSGNTYKSTRSGYIRTLYIHVGDRVSGQTTVADVYNDKVMKLKVPFLSGDAAAIAPGTQCAVTLTDTGETITGTVTSVSNMDETITGGRIVRYVHVEVENPGGLTTSHMAVVTVGDLTCVEEGTFEPSVETTMTAEDLDSTVEIESLLVSEGDYVTEGTPLFTMTARSAERMMRSYESSLDSAEQQVESAQNSIETTQDNYDNYTITAPISGQVITKNVNAGETITRDSNAEATLAVIYDLSALTFEMSIDEMDIQSVEVGQKVQVAADAFEGQTFTGTVTNVSISGSYSNGVTNYPVTVTLDDAGDLIPGMNVTGTILLDQVSDVLAIPADSLMRGNRVYVKDASAAEEPGVPAGFRSMEVETGLISDEYVEIRSGLSEGDEVYVDESSRDSGFTMMMPMGGPPGGMGGGPRR